MLQKRVIPCLLLKDGLFVKTIQFKNPNHISEPIYAIKIFNDYEVDELMILDIMASRTDTSNIPLDLISKISDESWMPITYGGGVRSLEDMHQLFRSGVEKVCISSYAIKYPDFITNAAREFGSQSIVVSIDVRRRVNGSYNVWTHGGTEETNLEPLQCAEIIAEAGAGEIIIHSIDNDGMMSGYDINLIRKITDRVRIPVIGLGGAGSYDDIKKVIHDGGASAAAAGSIFVYFGRKKAVLINYPDREEINMILSGT
ncbi:AglZ/HisF2 family acetamidino modification protein [Methanospirillum lacunae]|uniref:Imidazole glycerol phosphate synthase subunit HisF n=1 Tax=Methanospirillum lacunae TaxID=668570 RepID=A0A2V2N513_9EURY|nr:AglZ/HisF2 family acetamidino modification protein [Methanospirillum lacunae]PWR72846.1 imidazole glycerol phosphate synthase subunit HisF [Methanospirillum lacunae]